MISLADNNAIFMRRYCLFVLNCNCFRLNYTFCFHLARSCSSLARGLLHVMFQTFFGSEQITHYSTQIGNTGNNVSQEFLHVCNLKSSLHMLRFANTVILLQLGWTLQAISDSSLHTKSTTFQNRLQVMNT